MKFFLCLGAGILLMVFGFLPFTGLMSVTQAAYDQYPTTFDSTNSSVECRGINPEFEVKTESFLLDATGTAFLGNDAPSKICGVAPPDAIYSSFTNTVNYPRYVANGTQIATGYPAIINAEYDVIGYKAQKSIVLSTNIGDKCGLGYSSGCSTYSSDFINGLGCVIGGRAGIITQNDSEYYTCIFPSIIHLSPSEDSLTGKAVYLGTPNSMGGSVGGAFFLILNQPMTSEVTVSYTAIRTEVPTTLHYREFSCPLESGRYLTAETFIEGQQIGQNSFAYAPNYFCKRHGIIKTQLATQRSVESTTEYAQLVAGQTVTVPSGETWTFFYVPQASQSPPIKCLEGDYYDVETENCVKLVSGFVYVCTDPATTLKGNQCVKEADLQIVCPNNTVLTDGKCYIAGEIVTTCPANTILDNGRCYQQGDLVTSCPEGYTLNNGACYVNGKNIIVCPTDYVLLNSQCIKEGALITTCPAGYTLANGMCAKAGQTIITCPEGYLFENEKCYKQGALITTCPTGYSLIQGACYKEGETQVYCPDNYALRENKCYALGDLVTECTSGYTLKDGACFILGTQNMVCPDGTHKETSNGDELCIIDSTYCPNGFTRQADKCIREGEIVCPSGTIKVGDACQRTETVCPDNSIEINNQCVKEGVVVCPNGTTKTAEGNCATTPVQLPAANYPVVGIGALLSVAGLIGIIFRA